jgi:hypothetical protein
VLDGASFVGGFLPGNCRFCRIIWSTESVAVTVELLLRNQQEIASHRNSSDNILDMKKGPASNTFVRRSDQLNPESVQLFNNLFLFSLRFLRSTNFLCIFSAIFSYRSFSSLAFLLSLMACIFRLRSSSLSSFSSPSLALVACLILSASFLLAYVVWPAVGRNAVFGVCQFFPGRQISKNHQQ